MKFKPNRPVRVGTERVWTDGSGNVPKVKNLVADDDLAEELDAALGARPVVSMVLKKDELIKIARAEGVAVETDDNKADLITKIEKARKQ